MPWEALVVGARVGEEERERKEGEKGRKGKRPRRRKGRRESRRRKGEGKGTLHMFSTSFPMSVKTAPCS